MLANSEFGVWPHIDLPHGLLSDSRIAAKVLVRSAVFSTLEYAGGAQRPRIHNDEPLPLAAIAPYKVQQRAGVRLSQTDADVLFWLLSRVYCDGVPLGDAQVDFKRGEALSALGRNRGGKTDVLFDESICRLKEANFSYEYGNLAGGFNLLSRVERLDHDGRPFDYKISVSNSLATLLHEDGWLVLSDGVRQRLLNDPLAKGLHAFYASHQRAFPMLPATLKSLMGRDSMQDSKWRHALEEALIKVRVATGWRQCELVKVGPYAAKVVVEYGIRRKKQAKPPVEST